MYLKITNQNENHHGLQYQDGLVVDTVPFNKKGSCVPGGIYFTTPEHICDFLEYGVYVREVTIPADAEMVKDPAGDKWRASKVILGPRKDLKKIDTWKWLIELGANNNYALTWCSRNGCLEVVKCLVEFGADIHFYDEAALRWASEGGQLELVKYLVELGSDVQVWHNYPLRIASYYGHLEVVKYLVEKGADIHALDDDVLRNAS